MAGEMTGRVAFITGAASGMARETALCLGREGVAVAVADIDGDGANDTVAAIEADGGHGWAAELDVSDPAAVDRVVSAAEAALGDLDYLVNVAGFYQTVDVERITDVDWARMMAVHVNGTFHCCRAVLPGMMARRAGAIVNMASVHAVRGQARGAHYAAAKGAIMAFTKSIAREKAPLGIRANAVAPGPIDTPLWRGEMNAAEIETAATARSGIIPLGRLGNAGEVAGVIVFLLSPAASYITGQVIPIDGGETMV